MRRPGSLGVLMMMAACGGSRGTSPAPEPPPPSVMMPAPHPPPVRTEGAWREIRVCVVDEQGAREVPARVDLASGDTMIGGRPFTEAYPVTARYARDAAWYVNSEPVGIGRVGYGRYGLPRVLMPHEIVRIGDHRGMMMFAEVQDPGTPYAVVYAAVRPNCEFQPYQWDLLIGGIRG